MSEVVKTKRTKCLCCGNYMTMNLHNNNCESGVCHICKTIIYSKQKTAKEKIIKLKKV